MSDLEIEGRDGGIGDVDVVGDVLFCDVGRLDMATILCLSMLDGCVENLEARPGTLSFLNGSNNRSGFFKGESCARQERLQEGTVAVVVDGVTIAVVRHFGVDVMDEKGNNKDEERVWGKTRFKLGPRVSGHHTSLLGELLRPAASSSHPDRAILNPLHFFVQGKCLAASTFPFHLD